VSSAIPEDAIQGKAGYMSPEAAGGGTIDGRADLFSVGIIFWELVSGRRLYKGEKGRPPPLEMAQRAEIPALDLSGLPGAEALQQILARALERDPERRYASAREMREDLERYVQNEALICSQLRFGRWLREHIPAELIEQRRAAEQAALAAPPEALENTDHSHITAAGSRDVGGGQASADREEEAVQVEAPRIAAPVSAAPSGAPSRSSSRSVVVFVVVILVAFAVGVLLRLR
jgi:serine/threonine-protein kinase